MPIANTEKEQVVAKGSQTTAYLMVFMIERRDDVETYVGENETTKEAGIAQPLFDGIAEHAWAWHT